MIVKLLLKKSTSRISEKFILKGLYIRTYLSLILFFLFFNFKNVYGDCVRTYPIGEPNYYCADYEADWCEDNGPCNSLGNYCTYDTRCSKVNPAKPYACQTYYCDGDCYGSCSGDPVPPGGGDNPSPNNWAGIKGQVWFDFNGNGVWNEDEEFFGNPMEGGDNDSRCNSNPGVRNKDFDVMVHRDDGSAVNYAKVWVCWPGNSAHYFSHFDGYPGWTWDYSMGRHGNYIISLSNIPSNYTCDTWTTYDLAGNLQNSGPGCVAPLYVTGWNGYSTIDWKLKLSGCSTDSDCADTLFCTVDTCDTSTGKCSHTAKSCNDWDPCTSDLCIEATDLCSNVNNPVNGSLGTWSTCVSGSQSSSCQGFSCDGNCSVACIAAGGTYDASTNVCTRPCLSVEGYIWSDDNGTTGRQVDENFKAGLNYPTNCYTSRTFPSFWLDITSEPGNQIINNNWLCRGSSNGAYYSTGDTLKSIEPETNKILSLTTIPEGYKYKGWEFRYLKDGTVSSQTGTGGTTSNLWMPSYANWLNVHWELEQEKYNLEITVKEIPPEDDPNCDSLPDNKLAKAEITVRPEGGGDILCSGTSNSDGILVCPLWVKQGNVDIQVTMEGDDPNAPDTFNMMCPCVGTSCPLDLPESVDPGDTIPQDIGLQTSYKDGWVSAIDSDIFANQISVVVPAGPTNNKEPEQTPQGFAKTLINSSGNTDRYLGFIFSESNDKSNPDVDVVCPGDTKGFETTNPCIDLGGFSYNLISGGEHDSKWLESFTFQPPSDVEELTALPTSFESGKVYKIDNASFDGKLDDGTFNYTVGDGISILYIDGDINIPNPITTSSAGRLLIVVSGSVTISKDVGTNVNSFNMSNNPNIMAGIIASGTIEIESQGTADKDNFDKAIMFTAPFISRSGLTFSRNLYHDNNATMPAESAKAFNKYLYLLTSLEREESADNLYFTGLTTFDIDWEYIY